MWQLLTDHRKWKIKKRLINGLINGERREISENIIPEEEKENIKWTY